MNPRPWMSVILLAAACAAGCITLTTRERTRGSGTHRVVQGSQDEVRAGVHRIFEKKGSDFSVSDQGDLVQVSYRSRTVGIRYKAFLSQGPQPGQTDIELVCELPGGRAEYLSKCEANFLDAISETVEFVRLKKGAAAQPIAAAPSAPAQAAPAPQAPKPSDADQPGYSARQNPDDFALVIGIGGYRDLPEAQFAENDARAVKAHLLALGYPEENVITLLGNRATKGTLEQKLERWLPMNVNEKSTVFVYYSGHGAPDPQTQEAYLVPWDGQPESLQATALALSRFYQDLEKLPARRVIVAMDSCFSGIGGRSVLAKGARPLVVHAAPSVPSAGKIVALTASGADQISGALESEGHGAFTYYLLKGLNGEALEQGRVTMGSLYDYLSRRVNAAAHRQEREQNPQLMPASPESRLIPIR